MGSALALLAAAGIAFGLLAGGASGGASVASSVERTDAGVVVTGSAAVQTVTAGIESGQVVVRVEQGTTSSTCTIVAPDEVSCPIAPNLIFRGLGGNDSYMPITPGLALRLLGGDGRDRLEGSNKADVIKGHDGGDTLLGRAGNDRLVGGPGRDTCTPGPGTDVVRSCE